ncbi:hypothetical protein [Flavobacterium sp. NKUCC04_CG]|uniref:hypothetical protein n=1 Tax=Flavobacterium sp. NKUCC04_CG TaxID=2842121 RepID=UPI001C5A6189|nr:hypothetical protein [Flavobacterium sp. NKUCC04_CG]MBW3520269.1 hypothetical protein [Flavobacterium sp. NKUCC04_CG]
MKNTALLFVFLVLGPFYGQTGINEHEPKVSLHINKQEGTQEAVGVLFPRMPARELAGVVGSEYDGVLIYVTEAAQNPNGVLREVIRRGYYYYDSRQGIWSPLGKRYTNIIEDDELIFAKISRSGDFNLNYPSNNNSANFVNNYLTWHQIEGTPASNNLRIDADQTTLRFPKGHLFKITAMISIVGARRPGYVVTRFESQTTAPLAVSSWGYLETGNEAYQDGGVVYATTVINTHSQAMAIRLNAPVYGHSFGNRNLVLAGSENQDAYYYTHLIVEEL